MYEYQGYTNHGPNKPIAAFGARNEQKVIIFPKNDNILLNSGSLEGYFSVNQHIRSSLVC